MCLDKVTMTYPKPSSLIVDGWKMFGTRNGLLLFSNFGGMVEMDKWLQARSTGNGDIRADDGNKYQIGFHAYSDEQEARKLHSNFRRVYLRLITCSGEQDGMKCVVAQELYVPSDPDAWPPQAAAPAPVSPAKKIMNKIKGKP